MGEEGNDDYNIGYYPYNCNIIFMVADFQIKSPDGEYNLEGEAQRIIR